MFIQSLFDSIQSIQLQTQETSVTYIGHVYRWLADTQIARHSDKIFYAFMIASTAYLVLKEIARIFPNQDDGRPLSEMRVTIRHRYDNFMAAHPRIDFGWHKMIIGNLPANLFAMTILHLTNPIPAHFGYLQRIETIFREIYICCIAVFLFRLAAAFVLLKARDYVPSSVGPLLAPCFWLIVPRDFEASSNS